MMSETTQVSRMEVGRRIAEIRDRMDELDGTLVNLLNERATCARDIGYLKGQVGLAVYQPEREVEVLENVQSRNRGPLEDRAVVRLFKEIINEAKQLEESHSEG